jgi:Fe-S-cluster containining protein
MTSKKTKKKTRKRTRKRTVDACNGCPALCCHDLVMPITKPRTADDIDELKWELQYDTIRIFIRSHRWYRMIYGRCMYLDDDNLCTIYDRRPKRCRTHNPPECERFGEFYDVMLTTPEELDEYLF